MRWAEPAGVAAGSSDRSVEWQWRRHHQWQHGQEDVCCDQQQHHHQQQQQILQCTARHEGNQPSTVCVVALGCQSHLTAAWLAGAVCCSSKAGMLKMHMALLANAECT